MLQIQLAWSCIAVNCKLVNSAVQCSWQCTFLDQELTPYHYSSCCCCWSVALQRKLKALCFKWDQDEIWLDCFSRKYASIIDTVGFLIWLHTFKLAAMMSAPPFSAVCSSICQLPASPPGACDIIGSLCVLQFLIRSTFVLFPVFFVGNFSCIIFAAVTFGSFSQFKTGVLRHLLPHDSRWGTTRVIFFHLQVLISTTFWSILPESRYYYIQL